MKNRMVIFFSFLFTANLFAVSEKLVRHIVWSSSWLQSTLNVTDVQEVDQLLLYGFDVDRLNDDGRTLLHGATIYGDVKMVEMLILRRANLNIKDKLGCTALDYAARQNNCIGWEYPDKHNEVILTELLAAAMSYRHQGLPLFSKNEPEAIRIGRNIGLAVFRARIGQLGFPISRDPRHAEIINFINTLERPVIPSHL